jgi:hypothetical protein
MKFRLKSSAVIHEFHFTSNLRGIWIPFTSMHMSPVMHAGDRNGRHRTETAQVPAAIHSIHASQKSHRSTYSSMTMISRAILAKALHAMSFSSLQNKNPK